MTQTHSILPPSTETSALGFQAQSSVSLISLNTPILTFSLSSPCWIWARTASSVSGFRTLPIGRGKNYHWGPWLASPGTSWAWMSCCG